MPVVPRPREKSFRQKTSRQFSCRNKLNQLMAWRSPPGAPQKREAKWNRMGRACFSVFIISCQNQIPAVQNRIPGRPHAIDQGRRMSPTVFRFERGTATTQLRKEAKFIPATHDFATDLRGLDNNASKRLTHAQ